MAKKKFDAIVEAAHFQPDGKLAWVRAYLRRGAAYSDHVLLDRGALIERLRAGQNIVAGRRIPMMGASFETSSKLQLVQLAEGEFISMAGGTDTGDHLAGVPII